MNKSISIHWFRRDLRLEDNTALNNALKSNTPIIALFIFDDNILNNLPKNDPRVNFIYDTLTSLNLKLKEHGSSILIKKGKALNVWKELVEKYSIEHVYANKDYEPYALERDKEVRTILKNKKIQFSLYKDQVIFEELEVVKNDNTPYTVYTPYKNKWLSLYLPTEIKSDIGYSNFYKNEFDFPSKVKLDIKLSNIKIKPIEHHVSDYDKTRDFPFKDKTSFLGPHLRFGTVSIRIIAQTLGKQNPTFLGELIWREFFMQILFNFPHVVKNNFRLKYNGIKWRNNKEEFKKWCDGLTGYPMVDAGMRQLNRTGYMHNRSRMITAGFLCKHLLIDWRWGEAYFAKKLLDYELSSNNGNWQWASGTGCDAAPYFRVFNPNTQQIKFDRDLSYIRKWVPEYGTIEYPKPIVDHSFARQRAIETYKNGIV